MLLCRVSLAIIFVAEHIARVVAQKIVSHLTHSPHMSTEPGENFQNRSTSLLSIFLTPFEKSLKYFCLTETIQRRDR